MKPKYIWLIFLALAAANSLSGAEITGKVRDASGNSATVVLDGDALPAVGDSAEIFFKVPGADEEISVASGKVTAVEAKVVNIKIEKSTGAIEKDQLARFKSGSSPKDPGTSPPPASSPSTTGSANAIRGDWGAKLPDGPMISFSFKEDGTLLWVVEDAQYAMATRAKYRIDPSMKPHGIELFDIEEGEKKGQNFRGIFELQSDGRLKLDFQKGPEAPPLKEFTKEALVLSKAISPVVRPNKPAGPAPVTPPPPMPTPSVASTPSPTPLTPNPTAAPSSSLSSPPEPDGKNAHTPSPSAPVEGAPSEAARYFIEGLRKFDARDWQGAIADFTKAIQLDPTDAKSYANRGSGYNVLKQPKRALADLNEAIRLDPTVSMAFVIRGNIYADLHQLKRAIADYEEAIRLDPKSVSAYYSRGTVYVELRRLKHAIDDFSEAIALKPTYKEAYFSRSQCYKASGKTELAKRDFDKFQELKAGATSSSPEKPPPP